MTEEKAISSNQYTPFIAQLEGVASMGASASHLVLQSLVAQSANVVERLVKENERLEAKWRAEGDAYIDAKDEIERLRGELAEARKGEALSDRIALHWQTTAHRLSAAIEQEASNLDHAPRLLHVTAPTFNAALEGLGAIAKRLRAALSGDSSAPETKWKCGADRSGIGGNMPQDCDWPNCGCDETATKVIEALQEQGWMPVPRVPNRMRPEKASNKSGVDYIRELVSYCGLTQQAIFGIPFSRELEFLLEQLADAKDDMLSLHHAYVHLKYPPAGSAVETEPYVDRSCFVVHCAYCARENHKGIPPDDGKFYRVACSWCPNQFEVDHGGTVRKLMLSENGKER